MGLQKIKFCDQDKSLGQLGGGAWLNDIAEWPLIPGTDKLMLPLITLTAHFLKTPFIAEHMAITVFISPERSADGFKRSSLRHFTVNQQPSLESINNGYSKVLAHPLSHTELIPKTLTNLIPRKFIDLQDFTEEDMNQELQDDISGASMSKALGRPGWLQDPIYETPRYYFMAQIQEADIRTISPQHDGVFSDGTGYLFVDHRAKKLSHTAEAGYFFIQFT